jgi:hypothetical protein
MCVQHSVWNTPRLTTTTVGHTFKTADTGVPTFRGERPMDEAAVASAVTLSHVCTVIPFDGDCYLVLARRA